MNTKEQLEQYLLKSIGRDTWPERANPIHWIINVKDEAWFNAFVKLSHGTKCNFEKGDFTEINFVAPDYITFAGWRGNVMFTKPLFTKEEKPNFYTRDEALERICEFIRDGKIEIPEFKPYEGKWTSIDKDEEFRGDPYLMRGFAFQYSPYVLIHNQGEFVFLLRCSEGIFGELIKCNCLADAFREFGNDTFDKTKDFFDEITYFCIHALSYVPVYICRVNRPKFERKDLK